MTEPEIDWDSLSDTEKYSLNSWFMMAGNNGADIPAPDNLPTVHVPHPNEVAAWTAWLDAEKAFNAPQATRKRRT